MGSFKIEGPRGPLGFGFRVQGLGFRVLGLGFRDCAEIRGVSVQSDVGHILDKPPHSRLFWIRMLSLGTSS